MGSIFLCFFVRFLVSYLLFSFCSLVANLPRMMIVALILITCQTTDLFQRFPRFLFFASLFLTKSTLELIVVKNFTTICEIEAKLEKLRPSFGCAKMTVRMNAELALTIVINSVGAKNHRSISITKESRCRSY